MVRRMVFHQKVAECMGVSDTYQCLSIAAFHTALGRCGEEATYKMWHWISTHAAVIVGKSGQHSSAQVLLFLKKVRSQDISESVPILENELESFLLVDDLISQKNCP